MLPSLPSGIRIGELSRRIGVSQETLRAWERRYGVLRPRRTGGGYRVYDRDDEARARRMRELIDGGWAAAEAANAVAAQAPPRGEAAPAGAPDVGAGAPRTGAPELAAEAAAAGARPAAAVGTPDLLAPLVRYDSAGAHAALDRILGARSLDSALRDVVLPALHEVGEGWARGELSVAQEHFATELVTGRLRGLAREWDEGLGPRAVLACPSGERHDLGLLCCGLALHRRGWRVTYLGPDTPTDALESTVDLVDPALVVIGAVQPGPLHAAAPALARISRRVPVAVGGAGATAALAGNAGARHLGADPVSAAAELSVR
jgi:DNA-binding transcriptional MerR regulator/methanogenic corrinoid protein MtbC1